MKKKIRFEKEPDKNLQFSVIITLCFVLLGSIIYFVKNISYSQNMLLTKADDYYVEERYFLSAKYFDKAIRLGANTVEVYRNYGVALTKLANYDYAIKYLKIAQEKDPNDFETLYNLGNAAYLKALRDKPKSTKEDFMQAASYLQEAISLAPRTERTYLLIGLCYRNGGMQENARVWYRRALMSGNFDQAGFNNLIGHTFSEENRYYEAISYYKRALEADELFFAAYCNMGDMYTKLGDAQSALTNYKKALEINPDYLDPYIKIGTLFAEQNQNYEAIQWFLQALKINPDNAGANLLLSRAYKNVGRIDESIEYLKKAAYCGSDEAVEELRDAGIDLRG